MDSFDIIEKFRDDIRAQLEKEFELAKEDYQDLWKLVFQCNQNSCFCTQAVDDEWKIFNSNRDKIFKGPITEAIKFLARL